MATGVVMSLPSTMSSLARMSWPALTSARPACAAKIFCVRVIPMVVISPFILGFPPYNLSVSLPLDSSPSRGASRNRLLCGGLPRPPLLGEVAMRSIDGEVVQRRCFSLFAVNSRYQRLDTGHDDIGIGAGTPRHAAVAPRGQHRRRRGRWSLRQGCARSRLRGGSPCR